MACGREFVTVERAHGRSQLFTWYKAHPLLDAAERVYHRARQNQDYWKNPRAAVTDDMLDEAIASLPVVETPAAEPTPDGGAPDVEGDDGEGERERWGSGDLMADQVLKGRWTKWENKAQEILVAEFEAGADPVIVAQREAAKIIKLGEAVKEKLARERLRAFSSVRTADEIADGASHRPRPEPASAILDEIKPKRGTMEPPHCGKDSVTDSEGGYPREISLGSVPEVQPAQGFEFSTLSEISEEDGVLSYALNMASQGAAVFPVYGITDGVCHCPEGSECRSAGKHPIPALAPRGVKNATTDEKTIGRWFRKEPSANLAWAMGGPLRLVGVDVDPRAGGDASLCDLVEAHGDAWLDTFTVKTGSLGTHFIYRLPEGVEFRRGKLAPGIDLKYEGGYLVAPPSTHASGRRYEVEKNTYIAEAPAWLVEELTRGGGEPPTKVIDFQERRTGRSAGGPVIVEGERNERLFRVGCALWGGGEVGGRAELFRRLAETNAERVSPPLDSDEVWKIAESVSRYPRGVQISEGVA